MRPTPLMLALSVSIATVVIPSTPELVPRKIEPPSACPSSAGSNSCGVPAGQKTKVYVQDSSTITATLFSTSLSEFASLTAATTITTTDSAGDVVLAALAAGGAGFLLFPKPLAPPVAPPEILPTFAPPEITKAPESTSSSSSKSSQTPVKTQEAISDYPPKGFIPLADWKQKLIKFDDDKKSCALADKKAPVITKEFGNSTIDDFCAQKANQIVKKEAPLVELFSLGAGYDLNVTVYANPLCPGDDNETMIEQSDCLYFLGEALHGCNTDSGTKNGGSISDACLNWTLQPQQTEGNKTCHGKAPSGTGLNRNEALRNIHDFCSGPATWAVPGKDNNTHTYKPILGDSETTLSITYNPDPVCDQTGPNANYRVFIPACERFLQRTIDDCDHQFKQPYGKYGGNVTDYCGVFSLTTRYTEKVTCGGNAYKRPAPLVREDAEAGIEEYCNKPFTLDPAYRSSGGFSQSAPDGLSEGNYVSPKNDEVVRMKSSFKTTVKDENCDAAKAFSTKGDECKRKLTAVLNTCPLDKGGVLLDNTANGCVEWSLFGAEK